MFEDLGTPSRAASEQRAIAFEQLHSGSRQGATPHPWSERYDRQLDNIAAAPDEIVGVIAVPVLTLPQEQAAGSAA
jgi:TolB-like protein